MDIDTCCHNKIAVCKVILLWVVCSFAYSLSQGEYIDAEPFIQEIRNQMEDRPVIFIAIVIAVIIVIKNILQKEAERCCCFYSEEIDKICVVQIVTKERKVRG